MDGSIYCRVCRISLRCSISLAIDKKGGIDILRSSDVGT